MITLLKKLSGSCALIAILFCQTIYVSHVQAQVQWEQDRENAISRAADTDKYVLYHFTADWCRPCRQLEQFVFPSPTISRVFDEKVVPVKIDVDLNPGLVKEYGITGIPADVILTPSGRVVIQRQSPRSTDGYIQMINQLRRVDAAIERKDPAMDEKVHDLGIAKPKASRLAQRGGNFAPDDFTPNGEFKPNKFVPEGPALQQAPPSKESAALAEQFVDNSFNVSGNLVPKDENEMIYIDTTNSGVPASRSIAQGEAKTRIISGADVRSTQSNLDRAFGQANGLEGNAKNANNAKKVTNRFFAADSQLMKNEFVQPINPVATVRQTSQSSDFQVPNQVPNDLNANMRFEPPKDGNIVGEVAVHKTIPPATAKKAEMKLEMQTVQDNAPARNFDTDASKLVQLSGDQMNKERMKTNVANSHFPVKTPSKNDFALHGKCPVTLIQEGRWVEGNEQYGCVHRGRVYLFTDANKLKLFKSYPDDFSPMLAGFDPVTFMENGDLVTGQEKYGVFMGKSPNLRVVLFGSFDNRKKFEADPRLYLSGIRQAEKEATGTRIR